MERPALEWANPLIPPTPRTTDALLRATAASIPDQVAVRDSNAAISYAALEETSRAMAAALCGKNIVPGDVVAIDLQPGIAFMSAFLALTRLGGVALPLHDLLRTGEVEALVSLTRPKASIGRAFHRTGLPCFEPEDLLDAGGSHALPPPPAERDLALLRTTSGTTGRPKLIRVEHRQLCRRLPCPGVHYQPGRTFGCAARHMTPVYQVLTALGAGGTVVFRPAVTAEQIERFILDESLECIWSVPAVYEQVARIRSGAPRPISLAAAVSSGAPLAPATRQAVSRRWGVPLYEFYGQSELGFLTETGPDTPEGSVGACAAGVELRIVDSGGSPLPPERCGRVQARTDVPFAGYASGEEAPVDGEGWFTTGDLGRLDERGHLFLTGRENDLISVGGLKVDAREVAALIAGFPGVREAHCFSIAHRVRGEAVAAAIVAERGMTATEIRRRCRGILPRYKQPARVLVLPALPRTAWGKIDQSLLLEMIERGSSGGGRRRDRGAMHGRTTGD